MFKRAPEIMSEAIPEPFPGCLMPSCDLGRRVSLQAKRPHEGQEQLYSGEGVFLAFSLPRFDSPAPHMVP